MARVINAMGLGVVLLTGAAAPLQAQKTDVVVLQNGDEITGEVKGVSRGKLDYSTDDAGRLSIEWDKVKSLTSRTTFELELKSGKKLYGSLAGGAPDGALAVSGGTVTAVPIPDVVGMTRLDARFWQRVRGSLDVGLTYAKANHNVQLTSSGEVRYRTARFETGLQFSTYLQGQEGTSTVTENSLGLGAQWFVARHWSAGVLGQLQQNDELNLARRGIAGAQAMRTVLQNNQVEIRVPAGVVVSDERFYGSDSTTVSLEGVLGIDVEAFRFDTPKLDFSLSANAYPSLTESGRIRIQADTRLKYELFKDFNVGIRFSDSYDNKPPETGSPTNDFTTAFTIGWSFNE
jgi:uncharacterized protein DUF481